MKQKEINIFSQAAADELVKKQSAKARQNKIDL